MRTRLGNAPAASQIKRVVLVASMPFARIGGREQSVGESCSLVLTLRTLDVRCEAFRLDRLGVIGIEKCGSLPLSYQASQPRGVRCCLAEHLLPFVGVLANRALETA